MRGSSGRTSTSRQRRWSRARLTTQLLPQLTKIDHEVADGCDLVALDQDVGRGHLAQLRILGQDGSPTDEDAVGHQVLLVSIRCTGRDG